MGILEEIKQSLTRIESLLRQQIALVDCSPDEYRAVTAREEAIRTKTCGYPPPPDES